MEIETQPSAARSSSLAVFATDGELLMRFDRHRDQAAFAQVVERHGRLVWIVCKQALRHHQDVEDAFQATFLILAQRATTIRASDSAAAWLYRVAQRTAIAARRRRSRLREEALSAEPPQGEEALPVIHDRQMLRVLMEELQSLPQKYQMPLVMQYFEGQSRRAIAEQTDSTLAQIQGRLVRGKRMLRSRLMRRGVSLSLATGAIATASTAASAAVSPSLVAATAASSSSIIASGAAGAASSAAVELTKQGLNAMWYASLTKSVSVVAGVFVVAGTLWAAQQGDGGSADTTSGGTAANGIDLGAVAVDVDVAEEPAPVAIAAAEPAKEGGEAPADWAISDTDSARRRELERNHWLLKAKAYRMKAELMRAMVENATAPTSNVADAMLLEADADMAEAKAIELAQEAIPGAAHAAQDAAAGEAKTPNLNLWGGKSSPAAQNAAASELKVFNLVNSDATALVEMLQTQFGTGSLKFSADARNNRIVANGPASNLAVVEALLLRLDSDGDSRQDLRDKQIEESTRHILELKDQLATYAKESAANARRLEQEQLERALLQKELDHLHEDYLQLNSPIAAVSGADVNGTNIKGKELEQLRDEIQKSMGNTKAQLEERINIASQFETDLENARLQRSAIEKQLEYLERANLQLAYPQETADDATIGAGSLRTQTPQLENELSFSNVPPSDPNIVAASMGDIAKVRGENSQLKAMVEKLNQELNQVLSIPRPHADPRQTTVVPGDILRIIAQGVSADAKTSADGEHEVEEMGTIALGPEIGRVNVAGLSILDAEEAIRKHLAKTFENPSVQVVSTTRRGDAAADPFGQAPPPTSATNPFAANPPNTFVPGRLSPELFQTATAAQFDRMNQMLMALEKENADLKKQVEELRKAQPSVVR